MQRRYGDDEFNYAVDIWHDGYQARRRKAAAHARMVKLVKERDALAKRHEKLLLTDVSP
jgi:hypothetical protein